MYRKPTTFSEQKRNATLTMMSSSSITRSGSLYSKRLPNASDEIMFDMEGIRRSVGSIGLFTVLSISFSRWATSICRQNKVQDNYPYMSPEFKTHRRTHSRVHLSEIYSGFISSMIQYGHFRSNLAKTENCAGPHCAALAWMWCSRVLSVKANSLKSWTAYLRCSCQKGPFIVIRSVYV